MGTANTALKNEQIDLALERLELLLDPDNQELMEKLHPRDASHLPELSNRLAKSPYQLKQQLERLKAAGFVFSSKRFPKGYSLNQLKCLKIRLKTGQVIKSL